MPEALQKFHFRAPPRPTPIPPELRGTLNAAMAYVDQGESIPAGVINLEIRARLIARRVELTAAMRPGSVQEIALLWTTMIDMRGGFKPGDGVEARALAERRANDLCGVPLWAVCEAVEAYRLAHIGAGLVKPPSGPIRKEADLRSRGYAAELRDLRRVLEAKVEPAPIDEAMQGRIKAGLEALSKLLAAPPVSGPTRTPASPPSES